MLKSFILTSDLNFESILSQQNTSINSQTRGPSTPYGLLRNSGQIYVPDSGSLRLRVLQYSHDHPLAGHFGQTKTLHQVRMHYYWPGLPVFCQRLLQIMYHLFPCQTCAPQTLRTPQTASDSGKALELHLHGFNREAPSIFGYTSILVIVDHLSKQSLSSRLMTPLRLNNSRNYSFSMFSPSMVFQATSLPIAARNLYPISSSPLEPHWT